MAKGQLATMGKQHRWYHSDNTFGSLIKKDEGCWRQTFFILTSGLFSYFPQCIRIQDVPWVASSHNCLVPNSNLLWVMRPIYSFSLSHLTMKRVSDYRGGHWHQPGALADKLLLSEPKAEKKMERGKQETWHQVIRVLPALPHKILSSCWLRHIVSHTVCGVQYNGMMNGNS